MALLGWNVLVIRSGLMSGPCPGPQGLCHPYRHPHTSLQDGAAVIMGVLVEGAWCLVVGREPVLEVQVCQV